MPRPYLLVMTSLALVALSLQGASAYVLTGKARQDFERATSEGALSTVCTANSDTFIFWAGETPTSLTVDGKTQPIQFEKHKVGDYLKKPYQCQTPQGPLTITTKLTHITSNSQCGAGNDFIAKLSVAHLGSFTDDFLVDGCGGTSGLLIQGKHVMLCQMPDGSNGVGHCQDFSDAKGPRQLQ